MSSANCRWPSPRLAGSVETACALGQSEGLRTIPQTRIAFADTNWLFSLYYQDPGSPKITAWAQRGSSTLVVSVAVLAECRCNFWRAGDRLKALESDLGARVYVDCGYTFEEMVGMAGDLFRRYAPRSNVGTLDLLHVAAARRFGCQWFLSFDSASGCRAVPHGCGLKAFPELTAEDRAWIRRIGGGNRVLRKMRNEARFRIVMVPGQ